MTPTQTTDIPIPLPVREEATEIYQDFLDATSAGILSGATDAFLSRVILPFVMRTAAHETVLETLEDLGADTERVSAALREMQVTDFIRLVKRAHFLDDDTIEGWHTTYALHNANAATPPYDNRLILKKTDGVWKVALSEHELSSVGGLPLTYLQATPGSFTEQWQSGRTQASDPRICAKPIYTAYLASLDRANVARDFSAWSRHFAFPMLWHLSDSDHEITDAEQIRGAFFDNQNALEVDGKPGRIHRRVKAAEFLTDGRILGYHDLEWRHAEEVIFGPVSSRVVLRMQDGHLAAEDVTNNLDTAVFLEGTFAPKGTLPTFREIKRRGQADGTRIQTDNKDATR